MRLSAITLSVFGAIAAVPASAQMAPPGYHYEPGSYTLTPNDPCWRPELVSPGAIQNVNASIGKKDGVPAHVTAMTDLATAEPVSMSSIGFRLPGDAGSLSCHVTLHFENGTADSGVLTISDPGQYAPLQITWIPDTKIAAQLARIDQLRTRKSLLVVPDLKTPAIQVCVGRAMALGGSEQFPGQLWAACADRISHGVQ